MHSTKRQRPLSVSVVTAGFLSTCFRHTRRSTTEGDLSSLPKSAPGLFETSPKKATEPLRPKNTTNPLVKSLLMVWRF